LVSLLRLKTAKVARRIMDNFYVNVLGKPRLKMDSLKNFKSAELEKKFPYLTAYSKN